MDANLGRFPGHRPDSHSPTESSSTSCTTIPSGRPIFERLFRTSSIDAVLTFLDEQSTRGADARMVASLPWSPFLRAASAELAAAATQSLRRLAQ